MTTDDFMLELFLKIDAQMGTLPKHPQAGLYPSELVTLGMLFGLKGSGERAFYRWVKRELGQWFPHLPERTRLFRLFTSHRDWTNRFLADPSLLGVADTYGVELLHPRREGRSPHQLGAKGTSNLRWIVGAKLAFVLNHVGLVCAWDCDWASVSDQAFRPLIARFAEQGVEIGVHLVERVHDQDLGQAEVRGVIPDGVGADAEAVGGIDHDEGEVADAQGAEALADEVRVARGVEEVEFAVLPLEVEQRRMHRDLVLVLARVVIGGRGAGGDGAHAADPAGTGQHGFGEHGFARGRVAQDGKVSQV